MNNHHRIAARCSRAVITLLIAGLMIGNLAGAVFAHALGNFTINHFTRIQVGVERIKLHYVVDMAEIPALQELQAADAKGNGTPTAAELDAYAVRAAATYGEKLSLTLDGVRLSLKPVKWQLSLPPGAGGLQTLRLECDYETAPLHQGTEKAQRLRFEDTNHPNHLGWHELFATPEGGVAIFDSSAYGNSVTDELKTYPDNLTAGPLNERTAELSFTKTQVPNNSATLRLRDNQLYAPVVASASRDANGTATTVDQSSTPANALSSFFENSQAIGRSRDRLTELIAVPTLTPLVALLGLLFAMVLGGLHAMSPGHGKTVVGAYLVGSRGTVKHAAFLGITVTITHTLGVFALGLVTLFASQYIVPERLFPILSLISGGIVLVIGLTLFQRRLRAAFGSNGQPHSHDGHEHTHEHRPHQHGLDHAHGHAHDHEHGHTHEPATHEHVAHTHSHHTHDGHATDPTMPHSHGGSTHTHLPPGADGAPVTWRSLLGLGISGGLLPCPSALVVLLSAISLHRVGYGLVLVIAFSFGLAATLTAVGLAFVYAGRWLQRPSLTSGRLVRLLPIGSAFVIACAGAFICYEALNQAGFRLSL